MFARRLRPLSVLIGALLLLGVVPAFVLAVPPSGPPGLSKEKPPEVEVTLEGTVASATDDRGRTHFSLTVGDVTYELSAGPHWYWRDNNPLAAHVGQEVTVVGESAEGSTDVDVRSVNGTEIRTRGRPPWAGGWKTVGAQHPGWSEEKSARWGLKFGDCFPPGHCKEKPSKTDHGSETVPSGDEAPAG